MKGVRLIGGPLDRGFTVQHFFLKFSTVKKTTEKKK